jgi:hypothetical protein
MQVSHPLFGELEYDDYEGYVTKKIVMFSGKETEVELIISETLGNGGIEKEHCEAYEALLANWDKIVPDVLQAIIKYQNDEWDSTDYTQSFPKFKTVNDVLENIELTSITINSLTPEYREQEGRYVILIFGAEWVNDDYHLLSVALINEKVVEVTDQDI